LDDEITVNVDNMILDTQHERGLSSSSIYYFLSFFFQYEHTITMLKVKRIEDNYVYVIIVIKLVLEKKLKITMLS